MRAGIFCLLLFPVFASAQLQEIINEWEKDKDLRNASIGFSVIDTRSGKTISEYHASTALVPASTLKVVTTGAALAILGNNFRYTTKLAYTGTFDKVTGIINGDLVIIGSGDPSLQSDYFNSENENLTDKWAIALKEKGVKGITGTIIADASCFERTIPDQWIWGDIGNYFGAAPCGLTFRDNKFGMFFNSGKQGEQAILSEIQQPYLKNKIEIRSDVSSNGDSDEAYVYGDPFGWKKLVSGTIPPERKNYQVEAALPDPALLCAESLFTSLTKAGIKCQSDVRTVYEKNDSLNYTLLYSHTSPTVDQLIYHTNLKSNNLYCESLLLTMGKGKRNAGINAVKKYWQTKGLDSTEVFMSDGCGLARSNVVTPQFLASVLSKTRRDSIAYKIISNSLPVAGKRGSMASVGNGSDIEGRLRAKTGYISRVRSYAGYVTSKSGKELAFAVIFNNYNCTPTQAKQKIERFLIALYSL